MRYWFDTEFMDNGRTIELISIGIVAVDGREYYAENSEADLTAANDFVVKNVIPHLEGGAALKSRAQIADEIRQFAGPAPEFWAYYGAYDWVVLCQLYGAMVDLPRGWPMFVLDVKQWAMTLGDPPLPDKPTDRAHNALIDARWTRRAWDFLHDEEVYRAC